MGDGEKAPLRLQFNPKIRLEFHGSTITSDAGLLAFRGFDDALGLTEIAEDYLQDRRTGRNILHHLVPLLRQSIFSRLAGYDDTNDADRLAYDPAMRVVVGWQGSERKAASTSEMGRFETETLTEEKNLKGLARMNSQWVEGAMVHTPHRRVILDMDSSESPVHGQQEGAAYNGHFECVCYHPLFLFNQFGDCELEIEKLPTNCQERTAMARSWPNTKDQAPYLAMRRCNTRGRGRKWRPNQQGVSPHPQECREHRTLLGVEDLRRGRGVVCG